MELDLNIWEMTATYYSVNPGPDPSATAFPSMWFQFAEDVDNESRLFYGFPVLPFGPPNLARISVDAASTQITDPDQRHTNVVNSDDVANVQKFIKERVVGVDDTVPAQALTCLQTNVFGWSTANTLRGLRLFADCIAHRQHVCARLYTGKVSPRRREG